MADNPNNPTGVPPAVSTQPAPHPVIPAVVHPVLHPAVPPVVHATPPVHATALKESVVHHTGRWLVKLANHPQQEVKAGSRGEAWTAYKKLFGIVASEYPPEISEIREEKVTV
jgi:hypothetical protein